MSVTIKEPEIIYPPGFDERWEGEMTAKGYIENLVVRFDDGGRFRVCCYDSLRILNRWRNPALLISPNLDSSWFPK